MRAGNSGFQPVVNRSDFLARDRTLGLHDDACQKAARGATAHVDDSSETLPFQKNSP